MRQSIDYDLSSWRVWQSRVVDRSASLYFQKLQHTRSRIEKAREAATMLFQPGTKHLNMQFDELKCVKANYESVRNYIKKIVKDNQLDGEQNVVWCFGRAGTRDWSAG